MKLSVLQDGFSKAVSTASRFASTKAQLPVLGNILLSANSSRVVVSSTNLEISVSTSVASKTDESGEISVPAKILNDIVSNLPKETLRLDSAKEQLKISTTGFSSKVLGMAASDFPKIPSVIPQNGSISFPQKEFSEALSEVVFATSTDETRPVLTGVLVVLKDNKMSLVATDGFRLSKKTLTVQGGKDLNLVLPRSVLLELLRDSSDEENLLFYYNEKDKQAMFGVGNTVLTSRLLEGEYPDFEKIIPKDNTVKVKADKEDFLRAVKLSSIFARDAANVVKIEITKNGLKIIAESSQSGSQVAEVEAKVESAKNEDVEISFNFKFLEDFLHSVKGDEIQMEFSTNTAAGVFKDSADNSYLHLIMPVRT